MQRLLQAVDAVDDAVHIPPVVHRNPAVPSRIRRLIEAVGENSGPVVAQMARDLQAAGVQALAMPRSTAHSHAPQIIAARPLPVLDMRATTVAALPQGRIARVARPVVRLAEPFDAALAGAGIMPVWPGAEGPVLALIQLLRSDDTGPEAHRAMVALAEAAGGHVLVARTELPILTGGLLGPRADSPCCLVGAIQDFARS